MRFQDKKLILFDLDGTLIDSVPDIAIAINAMLKELNRTLYTESTIRTFIGKGAKELVCSALKNSSLILNSFDEVLFEKAFTLFMNKYGENVCEHTVLYGNVSNTLIELKERGYQLALVTNKPERFIAPILERFDLQYLFDICLGGDSLSEKKPHPMPLIYACNKLNIAPTKAVMIGDSKNDILAARSAEMDSIGVTYGYNYEQHISLSKPTKVVDDMSELLTFFLGVHN